MVKVPIIITKPFFFLTDHLKAAISAVLDTLAAKKRGQMLFGLRIQSTASVTNGQ